MLRKLSFTDPANLHNVKYITEDAYHFRYKVEEVEKEFKKFKWIFKRDTEQNMNSF